MPQLSLSCPHCLTTRIGFTPRNAVAIERNLIFLFLQCEGCGRGIIAEVQSSMDHVSVWMQGHPHYNSPGNIVQTYPSHMGPEAPADVPENVRSAFLSGLTNLKLPGGANAAAIMFRRSIELAAKKLKPDGKGNLQRRIADLSPDLVTPAMKEWAQHLRLEANDATHDEEEFSKEDAETLHVFAEMFLTYAFTLPEMLKRATSKA